MAEFIDGVARIKIPTPYKVGDVYVYVLKEDALTLVDTGIGTSEAKATLLAELKTLNLTIDDFDQIVLTHHHPDHSGGLNYLKPSIPVLAHANNERWLTKSPEFLQCYLQFYQKLFTSFGVPIESFQAIEKFRNNLKYTGNGTITELLKEGDTISGHSQWKVIETFGHASSQISLLNEHTGAFIAGDALIEHITPNPLIEPPLLEDGKRYSSLLEHNYTLRKLQQLPINYVLPGHGNVFHHVQDVIENAFFFQRQRALKALQIIKQKPCSAYELCVQLFPNSFEKELMLTLSETIAQIDYLEHVSVIGTRQEEEKLIYFA